MNLKKSSNYTIDEQSGDIVMNHSEYKIIGGTSESLINEPMMPKIYGQTATTARGNMDVTQYQNKNISSKMPSMRRLESTSRLRPGTSSAHRMGSSRSN